MMVRNIDLPEALILYGIDAVGDPPHDGLVDLLKECQEIATATILVHEAECSPSEEVAEHCSHLLPTTKPSSPIQDLLYVLETTQIQPRPFGGSSGFGSQPAEPPRSLLPARCVVISASLATTRAARAVGMRVMAVDMNDELADAALLDATVIDFGVDDIATPGSFWLNPPHPRDDAGNRVDPYELVQTESQAQQDASRSSSSDRSDHTSDEGESAPPLDEEDLESILADLAPLK